MRAPWSGLGVGNSANPVECGRKFCPSCGRWRLIIDFSAHTRRGTHVVPASHCYGCARRANLIVNIDPVRAERRREYHRIWSEARRRRNGAPVSPRTLARELAPPSSRWTVPTAPLRRLIRAWLDEDDEYTLETLSLAADVGERVIGRILNENDNVSVPVADRLLIVLGHHLDDVYDEVIA